MKETARTLVFTGERQVELCEYPIPEVTDDKVLVKIEASALCTWEQRVYSGVKKVDFPFIGGHEMVGKIVDMGKNVDRREWAIGDTVVVGAMLPCKNCYRCKSGAKLLGTANSNSVDFVKATRMISQGVVDMKPFVSEVYELEDYQKAFESAAKGDKFRVIIKF